MTFSGKVHTGVCGSAGKGSKVLCTLACGPHEALLDLALPSFHRFADAQGYELRTVPPDQVTDRPAAWQKILVLQEALRRYDWALWVDADALIIRHDVDPITLTDTDHDIYLVEHEAGRSRLPNTGVWLLRSSPMAQEALAATWRQEQFIEHYFWENAAFMHVLGYRTPPLPGPVRLLRGLARRMTGVDLWPVGPVRPSAVRDRTAFLGEEWNLLVKQRGLAPARIRHYAGMSLDERLRKMRQDATPS